LSSLQWKPRFATGERKKGEKRGSESSRAGLGSNRPFEKREKKEKVFAHYSSHYHRPLLKPGRKKGRGKVQRILVLPARVGLLTEKGERKKSRPLPLSSCLRSRTKEKKKKKKEDALLDASRACEKGCLPDIEEKQKRRKELAASRLHTLHLERIVRGRKKKKREKKKKKTYY